MKCKFISFGVLLLMLNACMVGPQFTVPEVESPVHFVNDDILNDSAISLQWFEILEDPVLLDLIDTALNSNKNVQIAASRIEQSRIYLGMTKADVYPSFGYFFETQGANFNPGTGVKSDFTSHSGGLTMNWEIDFWGKYRRANEAAKTELLADELARDWVVLTLVADLVDAYYQRLDYKRRLAIAQRTLASRTESLKIIEKKYKRGLYPELDYNQAQIQQATAAKAVPFFRRQLSLTSNRLSTLMGKNVGAFEENSPGDFPLEEIDIPVGLPSDLMLRRPDIQEAAQRLKAQNAKIGVAQAMRFPSISLTGMLGVVSDDLTSLFDAGALYQATGGLLGPVFHFGKNKRRVDLEIEKANQYRLAYEQAVLVAFQEVEDALCSITTMREEYAAIKQQVAAAENAVRLSRKRYDGGVTNYLEVLDSERSFFNSEIAASEVKMQQARAYIQLYKALGGGWKFSKALSEAYEEKF